MSANTMSAAAAKFQTAAILFLAVLALMLGLGAILVFSTPLQTQAAGLMAGIVTGSLIAAAPVSWMLAGLVDSHLSTYRPASPYRWA